MSDHLTQALQIGVADNRVVLFRAFDINEDGRSGERSEQGHSSVQFSAHRPTELRSLLTGDGAEKPSDGPPIWEAVSPNDAQKRLSGDLYPVVERILHGDGKDPTSGQCGFLLDVAALRAGMGVSEGSGKVFSLDLVNERKLGSGPVLRVDLENAWISLFGTGIGLLTVVLRLSDPGQTQRGRINAEDLLRVLHDLTQPPKRADEGLELSAAQRYVRFEYSGDEALKAGTCVVLGDEAKGLKPVQMGQLAKMRAAGKDLPAVYRCVTGAGESRSEAGETATVQTLLLERLELVRVRLAGDAKADKGRLLRVQAAGAVDGVIDVFTADREDVNARLEALETLAPGAEGWAAERPRRIGMAALMDALLPDLAEAADAASLRERARIYSYAAVRVDEASGGRTAGGTELAFRLARRFDRMYSPAAQEIEREVYSPFETVMHSVATQGAALVVCAADGADFLKNYLGNAFMQSYLPIAQVCLHEYLYLLRLVQDSAILPHMPPKAGEVEQLERLSSDLARFRLYYRFAKVSHLAHHNAVLNLWRNGLALNVIEADLARDVAEAHKVLLSHSAQQEEKRRRKWVKYAAFAAAAGSFAFLSTVIDMGMEVYCPTTQVQFGLSQIEDREGQPGRRLALALADGNLLDKPLAVGLDELCRSTFVPPFKLDATAGPAAQTAFDAAQETYSWREQLQSTCALTREARECAVKAPHWRLFLLAAALGLSVLAGCLAYKRMPR